MPEVGLSGLPLDYPNSGTAVYVRNLVAHLPAAAPEIRFRLFVRQADLPAAGLTMQRLTTIFGRLNHGSGVGARLDKLAWEVVGLPVAAAARGERLLHSPYFAAPIVSAMPVVVTVHDLIPLVVPEYYRTRQAAFYAQLMARTVRRAAAIVTVSHFSARDIERLLRVPPDRIHVMHEAVDERFRPAQEPGERERVRERYRLPETFVLYLGGTERRKNLETLLRAWARIAMEMRSRNVRLVLVGRFPPPDAVFPDTPGLARSLGLEHDVQFIPSVEEEDKPALYRSALAFAFPSTYEGFGFTPLEAMACGLPVIASHATSIPEVVGDGGYLVSPLDVPGWAEALLAVVDSAPSRLALRARGLRQAERFSWKRTAEGTAALYRRILGR